MNQGLLSAWLAVTLFWSFVLLVISGVNIVYYPLAIAWGATVLAVAAALGFFGWFLFLHLRSQGVTAVVEEGDQRKGCRVSIGKLPPPIPPAQVPVEARLFDGVIDFSSYQRAFPAYANVLLAVARYMNTVPGLPASPVPGGHGGATLIQHSLNVVRAMEDVCRNWRFEGHRNKDGSFWYQVAPVNGNPFHQFDPADPILPLAAFVHDLGKVACYKLQPDGSVVERTETAFYFDGSLLDKDKSKKRKVEHDTEGAKILRRMPELWELPAGDVRALVTAVGYYHKIGSLPLSDWLDDRTRSLVELLAYADQVAGARESGNEDPLPQSIAPDAADPLPAAQDAGCSVSSKPVVDSDGQIQIAPELLMPRRDDDSPRPVVTSDHQDPEALDDHEFERFLDVLRDPNRINGRDARERIGFKFGDWIYVSDMKLRSAMATIYENVWYANDPSQNRGSMHAWTKKLLKRLDNMGLLMKTFGDLTFTHKTALFTTVSTTEGHAGREERFVMVFASALLPSLEVLSDCKTPPQIVKCSFGDGKAVNKKQSVGDSEALVEEMLAEFSEPEVSAVPVPAEVPDVGVEDDAPAIVPVSPDEMYSMFEDPAEDGEGWSLYETLKEIVVSGNEQLEYKTTTEKGGGDVYLFDLEEVVSLYGPTAEDLAKLEQITGGTSRRQYLVIRI